MKFGDIVINGWASNDNPNKVGVVVSHVGKTVRLTNGRRNWTHIADKDAKLMVLGRIDLAPLGLAEARAMAGEYDDLWLDNAEGEADE